jgi:hypothetical protein
MVWFNTLSLFSGTHDLLYPDSIYLAAKRHERPVYRSSFICDAASRTTMRRRRRRRAERRVRSSAHP